MSLIREVKNTLLDWMRRASILPAASFRRCPSLSQARREPHCRSRSTSGARGDEPGRDASRPGVLREVGLARPGRQRGGDGPLLDIETLIEVAVARRAIEGGVARLAAQTATAADFEEMEDLIDSIAMLARKSRPMHEATPAFHVALSQSYSQQGARARGRLVQLPDGFSRRSHRARHAGSRYRSAEVASHRRLLNVLRLRDPERAQREMEDHVDKTINQLRSIRNKRRQSRPA